MGQEAEARVEARAAIEQLPDLRVWLRTAEIGRQVDEHDLRHGQSQQTAERPCDDLRDERTGTLPGAAELDHVCHAIVGLHDRRQGTTFAQGRGVSDGTDGSHHEPSVRGLADIAAGQSHRGEVMGATGTRRVRSQSLPTRRETLPAHLATRPATDPRPRTPPVRRSTAAGRRR